MIYLITGPAGVGKSTVSRKIAQSLEKSVLIEGDDIYHLVVGGYVSPWKDANHLPFFWKNCITLIENAVQEGYDVVFNYILDKEDVENLRKKFSNQKIKFVVLLVDKETILQRDKLRPVDCQMGERCLVLLKEICDEHFNPKFVLDTSKQSVTQTCESIVADDRFLL